MSSIVEFTGPSGHLLCIVLPTDSQSCLLANPVARDLDALGDFILCLVSGRKTTMMNELVFQ